MQKSKQYILIATVLIAILVILVYILFLWKIDHYSDDCETSKSQVCLNNKFLFNVSEEEFNGEYRNKLISRTINGIAVNGGIRVEDIYTDDKLILRKTDTHASHPTILTLKDKDIEITGKDLNSRKQLASDYTEKIKEAIREFRKEVSECRVDPSKVCLDNRLLFHIAKTKYHDEWRGYLVSDNIKTVAINRSIKIEDIKVKNKLLSSLITAQDEVIVTLTDNDVKKNRKKTAIKYKEKIQKAIKKYRNKTGLFYSLNTIEGKIFLIPILSVFITLLFIIIASFAYRNQFSWTIIMEEIDNFSKGLAATIAAISILTLLTSIEFKLLQIIFSGAIITIFAFNIKSISYYPSKNMKIGIDIIFILAYTVITGLFLYVSKYWS